jgi:hypothetical protein
MTPKPKDVLAGNDVKLTEAQKKTARHALGLPNIRKRSYRNRYVADPRHELWNGMVKAGFATVQHNWSGMSSLYALTRNGAEAALETGERLCPEDFPAGRAALNTGAKHG